MPEAHETWRFSGSSLLEWDAVPEISGVDEGKLQRRVYRFGMFELDTASGELRKDGKSRPRMRDQALQILTMLLEKPDTLVTREELRERLWPADTFVDFDHGLNSAMNQVRSALGDTPANPRFVQTLPRRGYRFIAPVQIVAMDGGAEAAVPGEAATVVPSETAKARSSILSDGDDLPAVGNEAVRILFSLIQGMYLVFYVVALARLSKVEMALSGWGERGILLFVGLIVTAAVGIPVRCYLLTAMAFKYEGLSGKFRKLFPFVLVLDELWAFTPFLLAEQMGVGLAIACVAVLLYVPFSQRSLLLMGPGGAALMG
jgi:cholera toxin transcriptional activator